MDSGHDYYVLDAQYDFFGKRFATCGSDHSIRIWDQSGENGGWYPSAKILKASRSAVSKLSWSYPEFGTLIAACSEDSSVTIWEEQTDVNNAATLGAGGSGEDVAGQGDQLSTLQSTTTTTAAAGQGGAGSGGSGGLPPPPALTPMASSGGQPVALPGGGGGGGQQQQPPLAGAQTGQSQAPPPPSSQQQQQPQQPPAKWICRATLKESMRAVKDVEFAPRHLGLKLAAAGADGLVRVYEAVDVMNLSHWPLQDTFEAERGSGGGSSGQQLPGGGVLGGGGGGSGGGEVALSLSWNKSRFDPPTMVVGGNTVKVWQYDDSARKWEVASVLSRGAADGAAAVHDVSWAPKMGRSYHTIATAGRDYRLRIYYLRYSDRGQMLPHSPEDVREIDVQSEVWRIEWNVLGTLLASSGDDGVARLWRKTHEGEWALAKVVSQPYAGATAGGEGEGMIPVDN